MFNVTFSSPRASPKLLL